MDNDDNGNKEIKSMIKYISRPEKRIAMHINHHYQMQY